MDASQTRREFKFLLPAEARAQVVAEIAGRLPYDRGMDRGYSIVSEYYDAADFTTYWQKLMSHPNRRRLRLRHYVDAGPLTFLEIKHRLIETTVKRRLEVRAPDVVDSATGCLIPPPAPARENRGSCRVHDEICELIAAGFRHPKVRTSFQRLAFDAGPLAQIRITFDQDVRIQSWGDGAWEAEQALFPDRSCIMEVKSIGSVPYWFRSLVAAHSLVPRSVSKYTRAVESMISQAA